MRKSIGIITLLFLFIFQKDAKASEDNYIIQKGDTLSEISERFSVPIEKLAQDNNIENIHLIFEGDIITVSNETFHPNENVTYEYVEEVEYVRPEAETIKVETNDAKEWIAFKESSGSYYARNGRYIGRYQLDKDYLNGDYSPENQEKVVEEYVAKRYGTWEKAKEFWINNGWY